MDSSSKENLKELSNFLSNLQLLFIAFKLAKIINWSWWWVLSPVLIPLLTFGFLVLLLGLITFIASLQRRFAPKG